MDSMLSLAHVIDEGLMKLEACASSVESMMPSEECQPLAEELMLNVLDESKQLDEESAKKIIELLRIKEPMKAEDCKVSEALEKMINDLNLIEDNLEKFGYVRFQMPDNISALEEELSNLQSSLDISSESDEEATETMVESNANPESLDVNRSMEDEVSSGREGKEQLQVMEDEVTPFITKSRSSRVSNKCSASSFNLSSGREGKERFSTCFSSSNGTRLGKLVFEPSPLNVRDVHIVTEPTSACSSKIKTPVSSMTQIREKPKMPVLSKITYELLGKKPPEFSEAEENH